MDMKKIRLISLITMFFLFLLIILLTSCSQKRFEYRIVDVNINNNIIKAQVADTNEKMMQGLMYRKNLGEFEGMIFVFTDEIERTFWMKNTLIPLDMIFMDSEFRIVKIQHAVPCKIDPCKVYSSEEPTMYVLEVNAGFSEKYKLEKGIKAKIS